MHIFNDFPRAIKETIRLNSTLKHTSYILVPHLIPGEIFLCQF